MRVNLGGGERVPRTELVRVLDVSLWPPSYALLDYDIILRTIA